MKVESTNDNKPTTWRTKDNVLTVDAETGLISEGLRPLASATTSAIWALETLSGPPTFNSNCICLPPNTNEAWICHSLKGVYTIKMHHHKQYKYVELIIKRIELMEAVAAITKNYCYALSSNEEYHIALETTYLISIYPLELV